MAPMHWHVHAAAHALDSSELLSTECGRARFGPLVACVGTVLRAWASEPAGSGRQQTAGLLNKRTLLHEVEECVVALHFLLEWLETDGSDPEHCSRNGAEASEAAESSAVEAKLITVVDLCAGKGVFSCLLSYVAGRGAGWPAAPAAVAPEPHDAALARLSVLAARVSRIIAVEKQRDVDWAHLERANVDVDTRCSGEGSATSAVTDNDAPDSGAPDVGAPRSSQYGWASIPITVRAGVDIHDEALEEELRAMPGRVVLVGVHLCKQLSPRCVELRNALGPAKAPLMVLAPCCLPPLRAGQAIRVGVFESEADRAARRATAPLPPPPRGHGGPNRPDDARRRALLLRGTVCAHCGARGHRFGACPALAADDVDAESDGAGAGGEERGDSAGGSEAAAAAARREAQIAERRRAVQAAVLRSPCWRCGVPGHNKAQCVAVTAAAAVSSKGTAAAAAEAGTAPTPPQTARRRATQRPHVCMDLAALLAALQEMRRARDSRARPSAAGASADVGADDRAAAVASLPLTDPAVGEETQGRGSSSSAGSSASVPSQSALLPCVRAPPPPPPFEAWVAALAATVEHPASTEVHVVPLAGRAGRGRGPREPAARDDGGGGDERDWNRHRKCTWIVTSATSSGCQLPASRKPSSGVAVVDRSSSTLGPI